jgi:hypothetical protein
VSACASWALCQLIIALQKPTPASAPIVAFLSALYARVVAAHAAARRSPLFRGRATSFDTLRQDAEQSAVGSCAQEASQLIAILKESCQGLRLAGAEWHVTVQCCDAHGRLLKEGSDAFYALWYPVTSLLHFCHTNRGHQIDSLPLSCSGICASPSLAFLILRTALAVPTLHHKMPAHSLFLWVLSLSERVL